jgi:hypothetical protein
MIGSIQPLGLATPASTPAPAPATSIPDVPSVRLEVPADASTCTPCGREALRMAHVEQARDQRAMEAEVTRHVAAAYAASRPA